MPNHVVWQIELNVTTSMVTVLTLVAHPDVIGLEKHDGYILLTLAEGVANLTNLPTWGALSTNGGSGYHVDYIDGGIRTRLRPDEATFAYVTLIAGTDEPYRVSIGGDEPLTEAVLRNPLGGPIHFWYNLAETTEMMSHGTLRSGSIVTVIQRFPDVGTGFISVNYLPEDVIDDSQAVSDNGGGFVYVPVSCVSMNVELDEPEAFARNPNGGPDVPIWSTIIDGGETPPTWFIPSETRVTTGIRTSTHVHVTFAFEGLQGNGYIPLEYLEENIEPQRMELLQQGSGYRSTVTEQVGLIPPDRPLHGQRQPSFIPIWYEPPRNVDQLPNEQIDAPSEAQLIGVLGTLYRVNVLPAGPLGYTLQECVVREPFLQQIARMPQPIMIGVGFPEPFWTQPPVPGTPSEGNLENELVHVEQVLGDDTILQVRRVSTNTVVYVMPRDPIDPGGPSPHRNVRRISHRAQEHAADVIDPKSRWDLIGDEDPV